MNSLTENFDIAIQVRQESVHRILQAQHTAEAFTHRFANAFGAKRVDLVMNSPSLRMIPLIGQDGIVRAVATSRVLYHSRSLADQNDVGSGAVADVGIRAKLSLSTGDPGLALGANLIVDWSETGANDIAVYGVPQSMIDEVKAALLDFISDYLVRGYPIPPIGSGTKRVGSLAFRFLQVGGGPDAVLVIGMNIGNVVKGSKAGLGTVFISEDWALAFSRDYVLGEILKSLHQSFGTDLPPPHGNGVVQLSHGCTISAWGHCLNWATVDLIELDVDLAPGHIVVTGKIHVSNSGALVPDVDATFTVTMTISVSSNQELQVSVDEVSVDVDEWWAEVLNFFAGGAIESAIQSGVESAIQSGTGGITSFLSTEMLATIASVGTTEDIDAQPVATWAAVQSDGILVHGRLDVPRTDTPPIASFVQIPVASGSSNMLDTRFIFHAGESWAPGGTVVEYKWEFPDRQVEVTRDTNVRFVTQHTYRGLRVYDYYNVCLTVTDNKGRTGRMCRGTSISPPSLCFVPQEGSQGSLHGWEVLFSAAPVNVSFCTMLGSLPLASVVVTVSGHGFRQSQYTGRDGRAMFTIPPESFEPSATSPRKMFSVGSVSVKAERDGVQLGEERLWMVRHTDRAAFVSSARKTVGELRKRLSVRRGISQTSPHIGLHEDHETFQTAAGNLLLTLDHIEGLVRLIEFGADASIVRSLLGIHEDDRESESDIVQRIERMLPVAARALDGFLAPFDAATRRQREDDTAAS